MFASLPTTAADPLHAVMDLFRNDPRADKVDLGVGVFRTNDGTSHVFEAVHEAERRLAEQRRSKEYLSLTGDQDFLGAMRKLLLGDEHAADHGTVMVQATGGTGALRLGLELVARASPGGNVHLGLPSWPNHVALVKATGQRLKTHRYLTDQTREIDAASMLAAAESVKPGDIFIIHGPCHNPSGLDLERSVRGELITEIVSRGGVPFIDGAYYGLAQGLEADLANLRRDLSLAPRALVAFSCSKSFGLYRERTATLIARCSSAEEGMRVKGHLEEISRSLVSMPPAHGAAVVASILDDPVLNASWRRDLERNRQRILALRSTLDALSSHSPSLRAATAGHGIFMLLPIDPDQIDKMARDHGFYLPSSGRINISGLKSGDPARLADALASVEA